MKIHLHTLINKFIKEYREKFETFLRDRRHSGFIETRMRAHYLAGKYALGFSDIERGLKYVTFINSNPIAAACYMMSCMDLERLYSDLKDGRPLDQTTFLELQREVSEMEFLLSEDKYYREIMKV